MQRNTLITLSDNKIGIDQNADNKADFYQASVLSATDYYAFGMSMKERSWQSESYRYGFNGKEKDSDIGEEMTDFGARLMNSKIGRWMAVDPHESKYPFISSYVAMNNNPISIIDPDGRDGIISGSGTEKDPYVITSKYFYFGINKVHINALNASITEYNKETFKVKLGKEKVFVKFNLSVEEKNNLNEAEDAANNTTTSEGHRYGNIVSTLDNLLSFKRGEEYASASNLDVGLNTDNIEESVNTGLVTADGDTYKADEQKLLLGVFTHEIAHNLGAIHGDGATMEKVNLDGSMPTNQIGGKPIYTFRYPTLSKIVVEILLNRKDKPLGTDYEKDSDYIQDKKNKELKSMESYGTPGKLSTTKDDIEKK